MANQNANATITEQVRQHGEMLVRLTVIVESHDKKIEEQEKSLELIAKSVAHREVRDEFWTKLINFGLPIASALIGGLAGHFIH